MLLYPEAWEKPKANRQDQNDIVTWEDMQNDG